MLVVADTGATVRVIGGRDAARAENVRRLPRAVKVSGAGGIILVHEIGDLPGCGGLMEGCLIMPDCAHSLCPMPLVCEEKGWGYQIYEGNAGSRFTEGGETVVQLDRMGTMAVLPQEFLVPVPRQKLAQVVQRGQQSEVAGGATVRGSWDHMWLHVVLARARGAAIRGS